MKTGEAKRNTTRRLRLAAALTLLLAALLTGCGKAAAPDRFTVPENTPLPAPEGLRIAVASDLHLNPEPSVEAGGLAGESYSMELVDALLWDAKTQGAQLLLLTGDLVSGGRTERHEALVEKLQKAEDAGLAVYVLPGNHDLAPIGQTDFAALYARFGYDEAASRDPASLSYCVVRDGLMLLMLDTGGYLAGAIDLPDAKSRETNGAFLSEATLRWAEERLLETEAAGLRILCAGHYNLLTDYSRDSEKTGYYLENRARLERLLLQHSVPLYLSGHLHLRAVLQEDGLTELLTEYLLGFPAGYSVLDVTEAGIVYRPRRIDVDAWAAAAGKTDPVLLHFAAWQQESLYRYAVENVRYMAERNPLSEREERQAAEFFYAVMDASWRGELGERRAALEALPGCKPFFRCAEGYAYGWWLKDRLENSSPLLNGFFLPY